MTELELIKTEIEKLRWELSEVIPQEIREAVELGDLRENSEYIGAVTRQHFVSVRLNLLIDRLSAYEAQDLIPTQEGVVGVRSGVKLKDLSTGEFCFYKISTVDMIDMPGKYVHVTPESLIGQSLLHKIKNDIVQINFPGGSKEYKIMKVSS